MKNRILAVALCVVSSAGIAFGQMGSGRMKMAKPAAKSTTADTLKQIEHEWMNAYITKDAKKLGEILAADWVGYSDEGASTRAQELADLNSGGAKITAFTMGEMKVRVFGMTAVVTGSDDEKSTMRGKDTSGHYTWTDVFVKREGRWQAVSSQMTRMP